MATKLHEPQDRRAHINAWVTRDRERLAELAREHDRSLSAEIRRARATSWAT
jgi:hypothetical protein